MDFWKTINGFNGWYQVSNSGKVKSLPKEVVMRNGTIRPMKSKEIKQRKNNRGYHIVDLYNDGEKKTVLVHRLVMESFRPNDDITRNQVNHEDGDKSNNRLTNLSWTSQSENMQHSYDTNLRKPASFEHSEETRNLMKLKRKGRKPNISGVRAVDNDGNVLYFKSQREASVAIGCHESTISDAVRMKNGNNETHGYKWYKNKKRLRERSTTIL